MCVSGLRIVGVETCLAWLTAHSLMRVVVEGTPPLVSGITAQMAFLLSRSTPSQRTRAQQNIWRYPTCDPSLSTVLTSMPATRRWDVAAPQPSSTPGPNLQVGKWLVFTETPYCAALCGPSCDKDMSLFPSRSRWHPREGDIRDLWQGWGLCVAALAWAHHAKRTHPDVRDQVPSGHWGVWKHF